MMVCSRCQHGFFTADEAKGKLYLFSLDTDSDEPLFVYTLPTNKKGK